MLDQEMAAQLQQYMGMLRRPFTITATLGDDAASAEMRALLAQIAGMSDKITLKLDGANARKPSFSLTRPDAEQHLTFAAIPLGHEFTSLVLALLWTGGHPPKVEADTLQQIEALQSDVDAEVYMSLSCHNCPDVVQAFTLMAVYNPRVKATIIDGGLFQHEIEARQIMGVPTVFNGGQMFGSGRMGVEEILQKVDTGAAARDAEKLNAKPPFEVLIVGGGPAGAAAAIYAARKGIRTGVVAERFGGQVNDTMEIANYPGMAETNGPQYAAALEQHARNYEMDIITSQRVAGLIPAEQPGGMITVQLENGGTLKSRSVILATGARWREMKVPGETGYRTKGVTFCPHCDGPLFKGKKVAVIGGGNSGVEAAIDLAGVVEHVTVLEFMPELKADAVLQTKLRSLPNVQVLTNVQTTEVAGDGGKVTHIHYKDRATEAAHELELAGIFVQIGLLPNTDFLARPAQGATGAAATLVERNRMGEIVIDAKGATNVPGVFAAGDCTTAPYKQIVIAAGAGATAALSAFDYLIRNGAPHS